MLEMIFYDSKKSIISLDPPPCPHPQLALTPWGLILCGFSLESLTLWGVSLLSGKVLMIIALLSDPLRDIWIVVDDDIW